MTPHRRFGLLLFRYFGLVLPPRVDWDEVLDKGCVIVLAHLWLCLFGGGPCGWLGGRVREVLMVTCVRFSIQPADASWLLMPVRSNVVVVVVLAPSWRRLLLLLLLLTLLSLLLSLFVESDALKIPVSTAVCHNTAAPQIRRLRRPTQGRSIGAFPSKHSGLIFLPVTFFKMKAPILGPEEKPDTRKHKAGPNQCEQREDTSIVDRSGIESAAAVFEVVSVGWSIPGEKVGSCFNR